MIVHRLTRTPDMDARITGLLDQGLSTAAIAADLGVRYSQVENYLNRLERLRRAARPWSPEEIAELERLRQQRLTAASIAGALDRPIDDIRKQLRALGYGAIDPEHSKPPADAGAAPRMRRCLMHGGDFLSSWAGERICPECRGSPAWRNPPAIDATMTNAGGRRARGAA